MPNNVYIREGAIGVEKWGGPSREHIMDCLSDPQRTGFKARWGGCGTALILGALAACFFVYLFTSREAQEFYLEVYRKIVGVINDPYTLVTANEAYRTLIQLYQAIFR